MPTVESIAGRYAWIAPRPEGWVLDGWVDLFDDMLREVGAILSDTPTILELIDVKDKLGTLRIRYRTAPADTPDGIREQIGDAIHRAEARSARTCDVCGRPGFRHANDFGWISTRCVTHEDVAAMRMPG